MTRDNPDTYIDDPIRGDASSPAWWRAINFVRGIVRTFMSHPLLAAIGSLVIFLIALRVINQELTKYTLDDLNRAIDDIGILTVFGAILSASVAYGALAFNDRFALSMLGKRLPHARTARASLAAYALANTLGYSWATAATARQRLYRKWGLLPGEIGALSLVTGTGVQVGGLAAAGLGLVIAGREVALHGPLNWAFWFLVGLVSLVPAGLWLLYAYKGPAKTGIAGSPLSRPLPRTALAHLSAIILDWMGAAAVLYVLLPNNGGWTFPAFLAVYVLAGMLGALSGAPGGLGVFEAAILTLAPVSQDTPGAAIALVLYRLIYNVVPLAVAALILGLDHAAPAARPAARAAVRVGSRVSARIAASRLGEALSEFTPRIGAILVFAAGLGLLGSIATPAFTDRLNILASFGLLVVSDLAQVSSGIVGVLSLFVASSLWEENKNAWLHALILLGCGAVIALARGLDWEAACLLLGLCAFIFALRDGFKPDDPDQASVGVSIGWIAVIIGGMAATIWLATFSYQDTIFDVALWWNLDRSNDAARALRAFSGAILAAVLMLGLTIRRSTA
jgi:phosphatidylglycerol lysyltransferase